MVDDLPNMEEADELGDALPGSEPEHGSAERSERLRQAVQLAGGGSAVARAAGMPLGTLGRYQRGRDMKASALVSLAAATGVHIEWLATGKGPMLAADVAPTLEASRPQGFGEPWPPPGYIVLPRLETRAAAGPGEGLPSDRVVEYLTFSWGFLRYTLRRRPEGLALIEAAGNSMEPTIRDGELLLVDTDAREVQSGRVYVIAVGDALLVKRIQVRLDRALLIRSDNPAYEPELVRPDTNQPLRILGEVIWQGGPVRN
jgi:phage repressor protein C with HTH and peptisase S24 domain